MTDFPDCVPTALPKSSGMVLVGPTKGIRGRDWECRSCCLLQTTDMYRYGLSPYLHYILCYSVTEETSLILQAVAHKLLAPAVQLGLAISRTGLFTHKFHPVIQKRDLIHVVCQKFFAFAVGLLLP